MRKIGSGTLFGISWLAWIGLVAFVLGLVLMHKMRFGQYVTGLGSDEESIRRAGVNTKCDRCGRLPARASPPVLQVF